MIVDDEVEAMFQDSLAKMYDSALEQRLEALIARSRTHGLSPEEREEVRSLSRAGKEIDSRSRWYQETLPALTARRPLI